MSESSAPNYSLFCSILLFLIGIPILMVLSYKRMSIGRKALLLGGAIGVLFLMPLVLDLLFKQNTSSIGNLICLLFLGPFIPGFVYLSLVLQKRYVENNLSEYEKLGHGYLAMTKQILDIDDDQSKDADDKTKANRQ